VAIFNHYSLFLVAVIGNFLQGDFGVPRFGGAAGQGAAGLLDKNCQRIYSVCQKLLYSLSPQRRERVRVRGEKKKLLRLLQNRLVVILSAAKDLVLHALY
jgi:hypothetical protein